MWNQCLTIELFCGIFFTNFLGTCYFSIHNSFSENISIFCFFELIQRKQIIIKSGRVYTHIIVLWYQIVSIMRLFAVGQFQEEEIIRVSLFRYRGFCSVFLWIIIKFQYLKVTISNTYIVRIKIKLVKIQFCKYKLMYNFTNKVKIIQTKCKFRK